MHRLLRKLRTEWITGSYYYTGNSSATGHLEISTEEILATSCHYNNNAVDTNGATWTLYHDDETDVITDTNVEDIWDVTWWEGAGPYTDWGDTCAEY